ncbi:MAG: P1 family peptidase [Acidimicrobiales bacterium]|nr:P1 family peptidase [Acidimicrobiales bacterium]
MSRVIDLGIEGVRVGHWTDNAAQTGCTVVIFPRGTVASGEVRGGAPATREFALLAPERLVEHVDAVVLTGGSAFGLASADGVVAGLAAAGRGFPTGAGPVPIVVALGLFDLLVGDGSVRPGPAQGAAAFQAATSGLVAIGPVGAGAGCSTGKWRGRERAVPSGLGAASQRDGDLVIAAIVAVNAFGDIVPTGQSPPDWSAATDDPDGVGNTTVGVVITNARVDKVGAFLLAQSAHDGLARVIQPAHTRFDGDAFVAAGTGEIDGSIDALRHLTVGVVEEAILAARQLG